MGDTKLTRKERSLFIIGSILLMSLMSFGINYWQQVTITLSPVNQTHNVCVGCNNTTFNMEINGTVNVTGNLTANFIYGEFFIPEDSGFVEITSQSTWTNITSNITQGHLNGFNLTNHFLDAAFAGVYKMDVSASFAVIQTANKEIMIGIAINGNPPSNGCEVDRFVSSPGDEGAAAVTCIGIIQEGDEIMVQVQNKDGTQDIFFDHLNLNVLRIGG